MKNKNFFETDEFTEAVQALEMFCKTLRDIKKNIYYWKWAILALHNSIQGFMVCALSGSSKLGALEPECAKKWMQAYKSGTKFPNEKLNFFLKLYEKIKDKGAMKHYSRSKEFLPKGQEDLGMKKLNYLRNTFIHFKPQTWLLEIRGLPKISENVLDIIDFLVNSSGNIIIYPSREISLKKFCNALIKSKKLTKDLGQIYES